jgi:hypothetical protein
MHNLAPSWTELQVHVEGAVQVGANFQLWQKLRDFYRHLRQQQRWNRLPTKLSGSLQIQKDNFFVKTFAELCSIEIGPTCCQGKLGEND